MTIARGTLLGALMAGRIGTRFDVQAQLASKVVRSGGLGGSPVAPALGLLPLAARAQRRGRPFRVGLLFVVTPESIAALTAVFERSMRELGYTEGVDVAYEYR